MGSGLFSQRSKHSFSVTVEHGVVKLLVSKGREVVDYRVLLANPRFFREGQVSNVERVAGIMRGVVLEIGEGLPKAIGGVPGFQNRLRVMEFPRAAGLDPNMVIPQEASRSLKVSTETYKLDWLQLSDRLDRTRWLVLATSRRSITSFMETARLANVGVSTLELRPFALARAVNDPNAAIAWVAPDGCDVVIVKDSVPVEHQRLFWGAEMVEDSVIVDRLTEVAGRTIDSFNESSSEGPLADQAPLYVCGSPLGREPAIGYQVAANLGREAGVLAPPLAAPEGFPVHDLVVNVGLVLRNV